MSAIPNFSTAGFRLIEATLAERYSNIVGIQQADQKLVRKNVKNLNAE